MLNWYRYIIISFEILESKRTWKWRFSFTPCHVFHPRWSFLHGCIFWHGPKSTSGEWRHSGWNPIQIGSIGIHVLGSSRSCWQHGYVIGCIFLTFWFFLQKTISHLLQNPIKKPDNKSSRNAKKISGIFKSTTISRTFECTTNSHTA